MTWTRGGAAGYQLFFAFECAILVCMAAAAAAKYALALVDTALHHRWPNKGLYVLYLELFMDVVHFVLYAAFFVAVLHVYRTVPFHLIFDVYGAYRALFKCATNYLRFRTVMARIGSLTAATAEDVERVGRTCIICRDDMAAGESLKKLACGHVFHLSCLQSWLERQQTCPICRGEIFPSRARQRSGAGADVAPGGAAAPAAQVAQQQPQPQPQLQRPVRDHEQARRAGAIAAARRGAGAAVAAQGGAQHGPQGFRIARGRVQTAPMPGAHGQVPMPAAAGVQGAHRVSLMHGGHGAPQGLIVPVRPRPPL